MCMQRTGSKKSKVWIMQSPENKYDGCRFKNATAEQPRAGMGYISTSWCALTFTHTHSLRQAAIKKIQLEEHLFTAKDLFSVLVPL